MPTASTLNEWFESTPGQYILLREQAYFDNSVADIFGFNAVQLGLPQYDFLSASRIPLHIQAGKEQGVTLWLENAELPLQTNSVDLILLPHILEFSSHPHEILREVERALRPEGSVIISGFNPLSLWGLRRVLGKKVGYPWCGNFISFQRMRDWLALLGFEVDVGHFACYAPPFKGNALLKRSQSFEPAEARWWAPVGAVYFLKAKKRIPGMRVIKPKWNGRLVSKLLPVSAKLNKQARPSNSPNVHWTEKNNNNE